MNMEKKLNSKQDGNALRHYLRSLPVCESSQMAKGWLMDVKYLFTLSIIGGAGWSVYQSWLKIR